MLLVLMLSLPNPYAAEAQRHEIYATDIASLQVKAGDDWLSLPVIRLGGDVEVNIDFDQLSHDYHRYAYRVEHCQADWMPSSDLFSSDFIEGFAEGNLIDDYIQSDNTNTLFTHYHLKLPNDQCRMKISGNYRVTVYDDDTSADILSACFMVAEEAMPIHMQVLTATDIDINRSHQQVELDISYGSIRVTKPESELMVCLLQNAYWPDMRSGAKPTFVSQEGLRWTHCHEFIFGGGNEYRKFETLQTSNSGLGIESFGWDGTEYHAYLWPSVPRHSYIYDQDANGAFLVRNWDYADGDDTSDYIMVHFSLKCPYTKNPVYIDADWTCHRLLPQYRMEYNPQTQTYETTLPLKQGYYSYRYIQQKPDGTTATLPSEGNFYQTENRYQCLVYYKATGARTHRLVGYRQINTADAQ